MLTAHSRAFVSVLFRDREGNERRTSLTFPFSLSLANLHTYMDLWIAHVHALSNAYIASWEVTHAFSDDELSITDSDSDVLRRLVLYYRNGEEFDRLWIPSGRSDLTEVEGPYAGIRLDALNPDVVAALEGMQEVLAFIVTPENEPYPTEFVVGGMAL